MSGKKDKLFAFLWIIALVVVIAIGLCLFWPSSFQRAPRNTPTPTIPVWFRDIDIEIRKYLANPQNPHSPEALDAFARRLQQKYDDDLNAGLAEARKNVGLTKLPPLSEEEKQQLKYLMVREHVYKVLQEMAAP